MAVTARIPSPVEYSQSFSSRVAEVLPAAARRCVGFARRLEAAGIEAAAVRDVAALDRIPVLSKDQLLELQLADPPFAGMVAPDAPIRRVFQSPGPLYEPEVGDGDSWRWAPALRAAGFDDGDLVLNCFSHHLSPAGAMFEAAALALGARVLPAGIGSMDLQARACADLRVSAYIGLPSYLKALLSKADELGLDVTLRRAFVTGEPFPPSLREWLTARVPTVRQGYGTAETGHLGHESDRTAGLHVTGDALVQICDITTGEAVYDDREGQVVVTIIRPDYPLVRFGTGDLSAWAEPDGEEDGGPGLHEPTPRIKGWLGRVGDAVKVRGMFLHPRQVQHLLQALPGVSAYRFVIDRSDHRDVLRCEVVAAGPRSEGLVDEVRAKVRQGLRFDVGVDLVDGLPEDAAVIEDRRTWE